MANSVFYQVRAGVTPKSLKNINFEGKLVVVTPTVVKVNQHLATASQYFFILFDKDNKALIKDSCTANTVYRYKKQLWDLMYNQGHILAPLDGLNCPVYSASSFAPVVWKLLIDHFEARRIWFLSVQDREEIGKPKFFGR